ncbi:MAG: DUF7619 domain-containing protein [Flavobacteriales bacterium]
MKTTPLLAFLLSVLLGHITHAQCDINVFTNNNGSPCSSATGNGLVFVITSPCAATSYIATWTTNQGNSGQQFFTTPQYTLLIPSGMYSNVCVNVEGYNSLNEVVASGSFCQDLIPGLSPVISMGEIIPAPTCSEIGGCATVVVTGGTPPYNYYFGTTGTVNGNSSTACNLAPGNYYVYVYDANGCGTNLQFEMPATETTGLNGFSFVDNNNDGIYQSVYPNAELPLANQPILIVETGETVYTNDNGYFHIPDMADGTYTLDFQGDAAAWIDPQNVSVTVPGCANIGVQSAIPVYNYYHGFSASSILQCVNGAYANYYVVNSGNRPLDISIQMSFDPSLTLSELAWGTNPTTIESGLATWVMDNQQPGTSVSYSTHINGPGAALVGTPYVFSYSVIISDENGNILFTEEFDQTRVTSCAYDPNDKLGLPAGMGENHYILAGTVIDYRVRFQNTGNMAAAQVEILDQLDLSKLDIETLQILNASHSMTTHVEENGLIHFLFENINLPDSASNEPASHGEVNFRIRTRSDLQMGDVVANTAEIYFDENPAIITNTDIHTIFDCNVMPVITSEYNGCIDSFFYLAIESEYVQNYDWNLDGTQVSTEASYSGVLTEVGEYILTVNTSNELCNSSSTAVITVHDIPTVTVTMVDGILQGSAPGIYEWYYNNVLVEEATESTINPIGEGYYVAAVVNEFGCVGVSDAFFVVGIGEKANTNVQLYPNPMTDFATLDLGANSYQVRLMNSLGQVLAQWNNQKGKMMLQKGQLSAGTYIIQLMDSRGHISHLPLQVK